VKKIFFLILCSLIFSACSIKKFHIDVTLENGQVTFGNFYSGIYESFSLKTEDKNNFYIQELSVCASDGDRCKEIWRVKYTGKLLGIKLTDYVMLPEEITYGDNIQGLATDIKPKQLPIGSNLYVTMEVRVEKPSGDDDVIFGTGCFKLIESDGQLSLANRKL
jgi:hypothetical protein